MKNLAITLLLILGAAAFGQKNDSNDSSITMEWDEFKQVTGWDPEKAREDRERFTIPWSEVKDLFNLEIENVDGAELKLPWREFKTLLEWSIREDERKTKEEEEEKPAPIPFVLTRSEYVSKVITEDGAEFTGTFDIQILRKDGWKMIAVLPNSVAVSKADLPDDVYLQQHGGMYHLLTRKSGSIQVSIEFAVTVTEAGGSHTLAFTKVASGISTIEVTLPLANATVEIAGAQRKLVLQVDGNTRAIAALPAQSSVKVTWERAMPKVKEVPPKVYSETRTLLSVADGLLLGRTQLALSILHTATRQFTLNVPAETNILDVTGVGVRDWRTAGDQLTLQLDQEVIGAYMLDVRYEKPIADDGTPVRVPVITAAGVEREKGHIGIVALTNVEIETSGAKGANAVESRSLPPEILGLTSQPILLGYRYVTPDFEIDLDINRHPDVPVLLTIVDRAHYSVMHLYDGRRICKVLYTVRNNRNQFLRITMPETAEIWSPSVAGKPSQPGRDEEGRILLPLVRSSSGSGAAFPVELVYVEDGRPPDSRGRGSVTVNLPTMDAPVTHLMVSLYVPQEGRYRGFDGTLRLVDDFTRMHGASGPVAPGKADRELQQAFAENQKQQARAAGATPVEVRLPIHGKMLKLEKILAIGDQQWFSYDYSGVK